MTKEGSIHIVNFLNHGVLVAICDIVKIHFLKYLLKSQALIIYIVMMTKKGSTKAVNFMSTGAKALMVGRGLISHNSEYVLSYTLSIYNTLY